MTEIIPSLLQTNTFFRVTSPVMSTVASFNPNSTMSTMEKQAVLTTAEFQQHCISTCKILFTSARLTSACIQLASSKHHMSFHHSSAGTVALNSANHTQLSSPTICLGDQCFLLCACSLNPIIMLHLQLKLGFVVFPSISFFNSNCFLPPSPSLSLCFNCCLSPRRPLYAHAASWTRISRWPLLDIWEQ